VVYNGKNAILLPGDVVDLNIPLDALALAGIECGSLVLKAEVVLKYRGFSDNREYLYKATFEYKPTLEAFAVLDSSMT
jgi:hypothetical protein